MGLHALIKRDSGPAIVLTDCVIKNMGVSPSCYAIAGEMFKTVIVRSENTSQKYQATK